MASRSGAIQDERTSVASDFALEWRRVAAPFRNGLGSPTNERAQRATLRRSAPVQSDSENPRQEGNALTANRVRLDCARVCTQRVLGDSHADVPCASALSSVLHLRSMARNSVIIAKMLNARVASVDPAEPRPFPALVADAAQRRVRTRADLNGDAEPCPLRPTSLGKAGPFRDVIQPGRSRAVVAPFLRRQQRETHH